MKKLAGTSYSASNRRTLGTATLAPYSPWASFPGRVSPSRSGMVSWSGSNEIATATCAPSGQRGGTRRAPARTRST